MSGKQIKSYYFCCACAFQFESKNSYDLHFESCQYRQAKCTPKESVTLRVETVYEKKKMLACQDCNKKFTSKESLKLQVETVHEKKIAFTHIFCDNKFSDNHVLNSNVEMLHNTDYGRPVRPFFQHISNVLANWEDWLNKLLGIYYSGIFQ